MCTFSCCCWLLVSPTKVVFGLSLILEVATSKGHHYYHHRHITTTHIAHVAFVSSVEVLCAYIPTQLTFLYICLVLYILLWGIIIIISISVSTQLFFEIHVPHEDKINIIINNNNNNISNIFLYPIKRGFKCSFINTWKR